MVIWHALGRISYSAGLELQERIAEERRREARPDTLLLLEHPATITLGRRASAEDLVADVVGLRRAGIGVVQVRRGGRATYHGPGQLVGYPIVGLTSGGRGVRRFVTALEGVLVEAVGAFGVRAERVIGHPGVWVHGRKIASIGIEVRRGISRHGFALNVDMDLAPFAAIVPCGVPGLEMTDLARESGAKVGMAAAKAALLDAWRTRFGEIEEESLHGFEALG